MEDKINIYLFSFFGAFLLFFVGIITLFIQYKSKRKLMQREKELMQQVHEQELLSTQLEMQTQTMQQIGREIHDNVGQKLTLASLYIQQVAYENKAPQVKDTIENVSSIINESLTELRQLSKSLTDDSIDNSTIVGLLKKECDTVSRLQICEVVFQPGDFRLPLSYQAKSIVLRVVQEFFQNSIKHSGCTLLKLVLDADASHLRLHLEDNGKGFDTGIINGKGIGLTNMRKRTEMIGGVYLFESNRNGTRLHLSIPLLQ